MAVGTVLLTALLAILGYLLAKWRSTMRYWQELGIPCDEPHMFMGNMSGVRTKWSFNEIWSNYYKKFRGSGPFAGFYWFRRPAAFVLETSLAKHILIKDFNKFTDRGFFHNTEDDPLSGQLFLLDGHKWKSMRNKLSPTFTSGKMKYMFPTVLKVGHEFTDVFAQDVEKTPIIEVRELLARFTTDVIGTCAFGIECSSLKDPEAEFRVMGRRSVNEHRLSSIGIGFVNSFPNLARRLHMKMTVEPVEKFFMRIVRETVAFREQNNIRRNDFMDQLIDLKNKPLMTSETGENVNLTIEEIAAQAFVFFAAGFETSSTTMGFALYELAQNQDIQSRVREEVLEVIEKYNGDFTYENIKELAYLNQVISETLRMYTVLPILNRECLEDFVVPENPKYVIKKGMPILIPAGAMHRDEKLYPNPNQFNPDNFSEDRVKERDSVEWLPFGDGPRNCIGMRFGQMQTRIGLALLLKSFKFSICEQTKIPMKYNKDSFLIASESGIYLKVERVTMAAETLLLTAAVILVGYLLLLFRRKLQYWQNLGIPCEKPHFLMGNIAGVGTKLSFNDIWMTHYKKFRGSGPFAGFYWFQRPAVLVLEPALAKLILIKEFNKFTDRGFYHNAEDDPLTGNLFLLDGLKWKSLRTKLSPTFTSGKMKYMFPTVEKVGHEFADVFDQMLDKSNIVEVKELMARFTTDVIGTCAFGIECSSLKDPEAEFRVMGRRSFKEVRHGPLVFMFMNSFPNLARRLHFKMSTEPIETFFMRIVKETVAFREQNNIRRNDFMDQLIELKNNKSLKSETGESVNLTIEEVAAQAFIFFSGGFETSSTTMGFALYELAQHQDIQDRVRKECQEVIAKYNGELSYEGMKELVYLDQIISETLRLYTVVPVLNRECLEDFVVPYNPKYVIKKGMPVLIPAGAMHRDEKLYPNPDTFNPDNFSADRVKERDSVEWLPFGDGPRNCIGMRFGQMQVRIGLALLISKFKFSVCNRTSIPMVYDKQSFGLSSESGIFLKAERLN
ncbi:uncharacterized protein LOC108040923 [Drosophila rhopaloa]|uniref:Cytochrome P450 6a9 n=2 Tax=Drosophila rhopaloa TaxID=1041015 RepID=A0ABM5H3W6_DRORH|nr:uncharacterized protein LOC108040923 [Drosophila rhopaloa]